MLVSVVTGKEVDAAAKAALCPYHYTVKFPATDLSPRILKLITEEWQEIWNSCTARHPTTTNGRRLPT